MNSTDESKSTSATLPKDSAHSNEKTKGKDREKDIKDSHEKKRSKHDDHHSKSCSRDKHREKDRKDDKHSSHRHHHRHRKSSTDRHKKSRRSSSSSRSSRSSSRSSDRKHLTRRSNSRTRRSRSRDDYRSNRSKHTDYEPRKRNDHDDRKRNDHDSSKSKYEDKRPIKIEKPEEKTKTPDPETTATSSAGNIVEMLKQIEVPRELRYNQKEAAKYQMEQLRKKTEEMTGIKVPTFYSTTAINPLVYAEQQRKRKLLWSKAKDNENTTTGIVGRAIVESQDEKTAEKFKKLMGIKSQTNDSKNDQTAAAAVNQVQIMQQQAFEAMDKEYQFARMTTHTHRGMGLGFASNAVTVIDPNQIQRAPQKY